MSYNDDAGGLFFFLGLALGAVGAILVAVILTSGNFTHEVSPTQKVCVVIWDEPYVQSCTTGQDLIDWFRKRQPETPWKH